MEKTTSSVHVPRRETRITSKLMLMDNARKDCKVAAEGGNVVAVTDELIAATKNAQSLGIQTASGSLSLKVRQCARLKRKSIAPARCVFGLLVPRHTQAGSTRNT